jgi:flagellar basal body-associated protein FliL
MDDENAPEVEEQPKRGLKSMLLWFLFGLIMCGVGFAVPFLVPGLVGASAEPPPEVQKSSTTPAFVQFGDIVVNLNSDRLNRYLRIAITLQVDEADETEVTKVLDDKKAILKSWLISFLSDVSMDDIRGAVGQNRLRRQIQDHFNSTLFVDGYDQIHDVLFEEFNVQ